MYLLINEIDRNCPALDTSLFSVIDDHISTAIEKFNTSTYFCQKGHSFTLAFNDNVKPTRYFECVTCTAVATDEIEVKTPSVLQLEPEHV